MTMDPFMIVMLLCGFPVLWIMAGAFASSAKLKKGRAFGLEIPKEEWQNEAVFIIIRRCRKALLWCGILGSLSVFSFVWIDDAAVGMLCWMTWLMLAILFPMFLYGRYFNCMKKLKMAKGWEMPEEERYWHGGILYYNKKNPKILVSFHPGTNTINLARLSGKIVTGLCALCILSLPFFGVAAVKTDRTEPVVTVSEETVTVTHGRTEYAVAYDDVLEVALLREMPRYSRSIGYESDRLKKGTFTVAGYGKCLICVEDTDPAILALKTENVTYIFSFDSEADALEIIDKIEIE
ncbi:MAG: hypothetical protein IIY02_01730 [Firmicutes bacterium]|nr:hypothetical protein [Bacillota bacterium]